MLAFVRDHLNIEPEHVIYLPQEISAARGAEILAQVKELPKDRLGQAMQVIDRIKASKAVEIEMPFGQAYLRGESERPLLLLAGGTGFSYIKSMFEYLAERHCQRPVIVYWGLREPGACYELEKTAQTIAQLSNASFIPVVENPTDGWQGKVGMVHKVAMQDIVSFEPYDIYLAGRFDMVGSVRKDFIEQGGLVEHMYADAFAFI